MDKEQNGFPLFDRIPLARRLTAINELARWQKKHHPDAPELEVARAIKQNRYPRASGPEINIHAPAWREEEDIALDHELRRKPRHQACPPELQSRGGGEKVE